MKLKLKFISFTNPISSTPKSHMFRGCRKLQKTKTGIVTDIFIHNACQAERKADLCWAWGQSGLCGKFQNGQSYRVRHWDFRPASLAWAVSLDTDENTKVEGSRKMTPEAVSGFHMSTWTHSCTHVTHVHIYRRINKTWSVTREPHLEGKYSLGFPIGALSIVLWTIFR